MTNRSSTQHYENFPVASWLCPAHLRAPIAAIYSFARTADDIADEGDASAAQRLADLSEFRENLRLVGQQQQPGKRWPQVFEPLSQAIAAYRLPVQLLDDLLDAFEQDVVKTEDQTTYATAEDLRAYCRRSANPVGRLLLHLYGIDDATSLAQSDCICTALQLINFWQDLGVDLPRGRHYITDQDCQKLGVRRQDLTLPTQTASTTQLIAQLVEESRQLMHCGLPLVKKIPGRAGWELRLVVQGGLRILEKIELIDYQTLHHRPKIGKADIALMAWRTLWM